MTEQQHPITPPPELVQQWLAHAPNPLDRLGHVATQAARWGADQELEACCWWLRTNRGACFSSSVERELLTARRPKPPTLAEQALALLGSLHNDLKMHGLGTDTGVIRAALERLQELENNG